MSTPSTPELYDELFVGIKDDLRGYCILGQSSTEHYRGLQDGVKACLYNLEVHGYTILAPNGEKITDPAEAESCYLTGLWNDYVGSVNT